MEKRVSTVMRNEFVGSITEHQSLFDLKIPQDKIERLADYYEIVQEHNPILHLVGPCSAAEFATRHILESLTLLKYLPKSTKFIDVGAGAGLPSIPCLLVRNDLQATLIESKAKKSDFLFKAAEQIGIQKRVHVVNRQFEETEPRGHAAITCRALDKFVDKLPRFLKWAGKRDLLLFGGPSLRSALEKQRLRVEENLLPLSERRYLFIVRRAENDLSNG